MDLVVVHHSVTPDSRWEDMLRAVERLHIDGQFVDFAYNGAASNVNDEYTDGRGPLVQGGATGNGIDRTSLSVVAVGQFHSSAPNPTPPTEMLLDNIAGLIARWIRAGHVSRDYQIAPHNQYYSTACCGDLLEPLLQDIRKRSLRLVDVAQSPTDQELVMTPLQDWRKIFNQQTVAKPADNSYNSVVELVQRWLGTYGLYGKAHGYRTHKMCEAIQNWKRVHFSDPSPGIGIGANLWERIMLDMGLAD